MTNLEFYKDELMNIANKKYVDYGECVADMECLGIKTEKEKFIIQTCFNLFSWALDEHKEPETDWLQVEVDTPILVRELESVDWRRRYFAEFKNGFVYAWDGGTTSFTAQDESSMSVWKFAKLYKGEAK